MHIIWKRPDGFQNAVPEDFKRVKLSNGAQLWLHKHEREWYPFQVSGDWEGQQETIRLNKLVNLLDADQTEWKQYLELYNDELFSDVGGISDAATKICAWIDELKLNVKGNTWEIEIIQCALNDVQEKISCYK